MLNNEPEAHSLLEEKFIYIFCFKLSPNLVISLPPAPFLLGSFFEPEDGNNKFS
jgi:hypothetical protein